ncbi:hypothetical protein Fcan01_02021 [Folsomia candida]|uniref:Uncharacterized protein n=1 Tax=Folsomia candida TaxID=158441 RepID=A0A226EYF6_FOLCA|nr:hypothetical protein Fcan01_02021 [Folsomia candida]
MANQLPSCIQTDRMLLIIILTVVEARKSALKSEEDSFSDQNLEFPMDNEDDMLDGSISLKYFQRGRSSLTELYMNSTLENGQQPVYTISDQYPSPFSLKSSLV